MSFMLYVLLDSSDLMLLKHVMASPLAGSFKSFILTDKPPWPHQIRIKAASPLSSCCLFFQHSFLNNTCWATWSTIQVLLALRACIKTSVYVCLVALEGISGYQNFAELCKLQGYKYSYIGNAIGLKNK